MLNYFLFEIFFDDMVPLALAADSRVDLLEPAVACIFVYFIT